MGVGGATFWKRKQTQSIKQLCKEMPQGVRARARVCIAQGCAPRVQLTPIIALAENARMGSVGRLEGGGATQCPRPEVEGRALERHLG